MTLPAPDLALLRFLARRTSATAVLNSVPAFGAVGDEAAEMISEALGLPVCPIRIGDRVAYSRCLISGQVAQEVEQLHMWTCEQIGMPASAQSNR